jgi:outer membrane protein OmpU
MKNVLFATTALVAMAGAASADISFSGKVNAGYNDAVEGGLFLTGNVGATASVDMGDNVTAKVQWGGVSFDAGTSPAITLSQKVSAEIGYTGNNMTASLRLGDMNDKGASEYFYKSRSGMAVDVENQDNKGDARVLLQFGNYGVAVGCSAPLGAIGTCADGFNVGAGATLGSIKIGIGYDSAGNAAGSRTAISADTTFGSFDVGVSYVSGSSSYVVKTGVDGNDADATVGGTTTTVAGPENSIGVALGYKLSDAVKVKGYFAKNSVRGTDYGVSGTYTSGKLTLGAYYDSKSRLGTPTGADADGDGFYTGGQTTALSRSNTYGVDLGYAISDALKASAGVQMGSATHYYAGVVYTVNDAITATLSYANANKIHGPKFKNGISAFITAKF